MEDILFLIPARSGSKGVKDKNIRELFGIPLLAIRGMSALSFTAKEHVWLTTDSKEYAEIGSKYGLTVPFIRPETLASDHASSVDVILHAMEFAQSMGKSYKMIALLEPTSPFVYKEYLLDAIQQLQSDHNAAAIVATKKVETASIFVQPSTRYLATLAKNLMDAKAIRRQDFEMEITPSGGFYIAEWEHFLAHKTFYTEKTLSYLLPEQCALEIDNTIQFRWAEYLVEKEIVDFTKII